MKKFFKKLFCKHEYEYHGDIKETYLTEDFRLYREDCYRLYKCKNCGKLKKTFIFIGD